MQLRTYQQRAIESGLDALRSGHNAVLQLATGTGKSVIIAAIAEKFQADSKRVWVLTHVQQLVKQNAITYEKFTDLSPGIICAGLGKKDATQSVTFATIQSMIGVLKSTPPPDLIIIDEAHRVPHNYGEPTLYESVLKAHPNARRLALTATPWRMDNGVIYGKGEEFWFNKLAFTYNVPEAVKDGWLCPLVGVETEVQLNVDSVSVQNDFVQTEVSDLQTREWLNAVADSFLTLAKNRKHIAVYCPTVKSAKLTAEAIIKATGWVTEILTGDMNEVKRQTVLSHFFSGQTKVLCSVDMITTGFDYPPLDCIVCLRPTVSSSLWVQIQGRGTRLHESKKNCLVLDYVGNLLRLGGVGMYETFYKEKGAVEVEAVARKPYVRAARTVYPGVKTLTVLDPMTGQEALNGSTFTVEVHGINFVALKTKRQSYQVILAQYMCTTKEGARIDASLFIDTERVTTETLKFFDKRSIAVKLPTQANKTIWQLKGSRRPTSLTIRKSGKYWNVLEEHFGEN